jgi:hypothetical protein
MGRELFERLSAEGWPLIEAWKNEREAETLHLEFKRKADPCSAEIEPKDMANVAQTLSAFANTEGGLLVLGVDAGGGSRHGFDRVTGLVPIANVERFGGSLERRLRAFTDPPIAGLMVRAIEKPGSGGAGVVAVHVPRSEAGPHRAAQATAETNDRYYMRTAAGAQTIPHSLLAALFAFAAPPRLEFRARFIHVNDAGANTPSDPPVVEMRLVNHGRSAARRPAVFLFGASSLNWDEFRLWNFHYYPRKTEDGFSYVAIEPLHDVVIYPGADIVLARLRCTEGAFCNSGAVQVGFRVRVMSLDTVPFEGQRYLCVSRDASAADALRALVVVRADDQGEGPEHLEAGWTSAMSRAVDGTERGR